jgi:hypothetical protein
MTQSGLDLKNSSTAFVALGQLRLKKSQFFILFSKPKFLALKF